MEFTFGIITDGSSDSRINKIIDSIEKQNIKNYEIIIIGNSKILRNNTYVHQFDETKKDKWITKKKNLITEYSKYENIVYLHDYIYFFDDWYEGQLKCGNDFYVRMDKILNHDNTRFRDWCLWPHNNNNLDQLLKKGNCILPYNINSLSKFMYISGSYWIAKKHVMNEFILNNDLLWGQGEDVEWSFRVREKYNFSMNIYSTVKLMKQKDIVLTYCDDATIEEINKIIKLI